MKKNCTNNVVHKTTNEQIELMVQEAAYQRLQFEATNVERIIRTLDEYVEPVVGNTPHLHEIYMQAIVQLQRLDAAMSDRAFIEKLLLTRRRKRNGTS